MIEVRVNNRVRLRNHKYSRRTLPSANSRTPTPFVGSARALQEIHWRHSDDHLVDVTPTPVLSGLEGLDDGVAGSAKVRGRVAIS